MNKINEGNLLRYQIEPTSKFAKKVSGLVTQKAPKVHFSRSHQITKFAEKITRQVCRAKSPPIFWCCLLLR